MLGRRGNWSYRNRHKCLNGPRRLGRLLYPSRSHYQEQHGLYNDLKDSDFLCVIWTNCWEKLETKFFVLVCNWEQYICWLASLSLNWMVDLRATLLVFTRGTSTEWRDERICMSAMQWAKSLSHYTLSQVTMPPCIDTGCDALSQCAIRCHNHFRDKRSISF